MRGAYSYPTLGAASTDRADLGSPVGSNAEGAPVVYFAGEATHTSVNPCLQAAMETGRTAAMQAAAGLGRRVLLAKM